MYYTIDVARLTASGFRSVCTQLTQLTLTINELKSTLFLEKNISRQICTDIQFAEKYGTEFPCKTLEDFMKFEENLKSNAFRQDFVRRFFYKYLYYKLYTYFILIYKLYT